MNVQIFGYEVVEVYPLSDLEKYKDHRRLKTFHQKGVACINPDCDRVGTQLILGKDKIGNLHVDVYTDDLHPITVDHIIPKSKGGKYHIDNFQPMCSECNMVKGNGDKPFIMPIPKIQPTFIKVSNLVDPIIGKQVFRKSGKRRKTYKLLGTISSLLYNPHTGQPSAKIEGNDVSIYHINSLYSEKP